MTRPSISLIMRAYLLFFPSPQANADVSIVLDTSSMGENLSMLYHQAHHSHLQLPTRHNLLTLCRLSSILTFHRRRPMSPFLMQQRLHNHPGRRKPLRFHPFRSFPHRHPQHRLLTLPKRHPSHRSHRIQPPQATPMPRPIDERDATVFSNNYCIHDFLCPRVPKKIHRWKLPGNSAPKRFYAPK